MADHIATQVRDAAVAALAGLTTSGSRVYPSRVHRFGSATVPGLAVYTNGWRLRDQAGARGARRFGREIDLLIEAAVRADSDGTPEATLDTMAAEVEEAMQADVTLGGVAKDLYPVAMRPVLTGDGESRIGRLAIEYAVIVRTAEAAPDAAVA